MTTLCSDDGNGLSAQWRLVSQRAARSKHGSVLAGWNWVEWPVRAFLRWLLTGCFNQRLLSCCPPADEQRGSMHTPSVCCVSGGRAVTSQSHVVFLRLKQLKLFFRSCQTAQSFPALFKCLCSDPVGCFTCSARCRRLVPSL